MFGLFKNHNPDKEAINAEAKRLMTLVDKAEPVVRVAVGHSVNMANSMFIQRFASIADFQRAPKSEQLAYIKSSTEMVEELAQRDPHAAAGFRLFGIWVTALTANDTTLRHTLEKAMGELSREGDLGG